jgi:hypothetical protein
MGAHRDILLFFFLLTACCILSPTSQLRADDAGRFTVLEPLSPETKHQVTTGGAMGFYGPH